MKLIEPEKKYWLSFLDFVEENRKKGIYTWFKDKDWKDYERRREEEKNWKIIWWLLEGEKVIGRAGIRLLKNDRGNILFNIIPSERSKGYGKLILKLVLDKAKNLGFEKIIVSCKRENTRSRRVIEANGGKLIKQNKKKMRYEIRL